MRRDVLLLGAGATAAAGAAWALRDYRAWRALGPGGLPTSWAGWWRMTRLRLAQRDPLALAPLVARRDTREDLATLAGLPRRAGVRPRIAPHPVPHRQLDAKAPSALIPLLEARFEGKVAADPARLSYRTSHFEKRHAAVTVLPACRRHGDACLAHGEVGHVHPSDGSMHMVLSPSDTCTVIARGWGELHGLAGVRLGLPATYTLIYAPRDEGEIGTISSILDAATAYMTLDPGTGAEAANRS